MAGEFTNTSQVKTNFFAKGMVKDLSDINIPDGVWTHAINAVNNSHMGDAGVIGNEPSNYNCIDVGKENLQIIGFVHKTGTQWVLFCTNNAQCEIGLFDESDCSYLTLTPRNTHNSECLNFKKEHLITGVCKENYDCTWSVYWQDGLNPDRVMNLDNPPFQQTNSEYCTTPLYSEFLECDLLRLHPIVKQPCLELKRAEGAGQLNNGSYMICMAYSENGIRLTDYSIPSNAQSLWSHTGIGGSLDVDINNIDPYFDEFELVVIAVVNQQTIAKKVGNYAITFDNNTLPSATYHIHLDMVLQSLPTVDLGLIPLKSVVYEKSDKMFEVNNYLIRSGVTSQPYFNYQPLANQIVTTWDVETVPYNYYWGGGNKVGYMRDEVYAFFIRWVYRTGARSASFHIPGRAVMFQSEEDTVTSSDPNQVYPTETERWQVYDTGEYNRMGYWESTEKYPNNSEVWGDLCQQSIRHHKMPSNERTHIHGTDGTQDTINILGVKFSNIQPPVDENGDQIDDIIGYEILRGSREGNRSIIAKGLFNNMWQYDIYGSSTTKGLFQNYPYNDLHEDPFLAASYAVLDNTDISESERLKTYRQDILSFHSPETSFLKPYLGENYIQIYTVESGPVTGRFEFPSKHPKFKLVTDAAFGLSVPIALGIALVAALGKTTQQGGMDTNAGVVFAESVTSSRGSKESGMVTAAFDLASSILNNSTLSVSALAVATWIAGIGLFVTYSAYFVGRAMDELLEAIRHFSNYHNLLLQYNSHGYYNDYKALNIIRRRISNSGAKYIGSGIQSFVDNYTINNLFRNNYVCVRLNNAIANPPSIDDTKKRLSDFDLSNAAFKNPVGAEYRTNSSAYYGAIKVDYSNQYGQLDSIIQIPVNSCVYNKDIHETELIFGGDTYINRYTEKNPYFFFNTWLYDVPDGTEFNYRNYVNGPAPRYWLDSNKFDMGDFDMNITFDFVNLVGPDGINNPINIDFTTPSSFYRLDNNGNNALFNFIVRYRWAYLFYNGVRDFYVESELNMAYRDYGENDYEKFYDVYGQSFSDLSTMFRSDLITKPIHYKYDLSLSSAKTFNNFASWGKILPRDYRPSLYDTCFEYFPRRVIYSLRQQEGMRRDNWKNFLPLNYKDFKSKVCNIKSLNVAGAVVLFEEAEPMLFTGVDQLQTTGGVKVTIGDGGLFQQMGQSIVNADDTLGYANCINYRSAINTPYGLFWISQKNGKIMQYVPGSQPTEISKSGMKHWFAEHLPSNLLSLYPEYPYYDNPVVGIGCNSIYDPQYEMLYFNKIDYAIDPDYPHQLYWSDELDSFYYVTEGGRQIRVEMNKWPFIPCNWTISYDPKIKAWISFHTWHPTFLMPSQTHFNTIMNDGIWKHNNRWDSYCNFYDTNHPWLVEYPIVTPNNVTTLRNLEYYMDVYQYYNDGRDYNHILDENFDRAVIYNSEQISGLLRLKIKPKNNPVASILPPVITPNGINITYAKEENKYRFDQFWDITANRGEFTFNDTPMWNTACNGWERLINPEYVDYYKPLLQRKKFRHYGNRVVLEKLESGNKKMMLKIVNTKLLNSSR